MTTPMAAIIGKGGVGKTFLTAHLAMAFSYLGIRTLVIGCDQKRDTHRALCVETAPSLMERLEQRGYNHQAVALEEVLLPASKYVDVLEFGPGPLLVADYSAVYDHGFHYLDLHRVFDRYAHVLLDVTDERFDSAQVPLLRRVNAAVLVTDDSLESLFVMNRVMRAILIGGSELELPTRVLGVVSNRSADPRVVDRYAERTMCRSLMAIPADSELARLRSAHRTLFAEGNPPRHLDVLIDGFLKIVQLLQVGPFSLDAIMPLEDAEIWRLADGLGSAN